MVSSVGSTNNLVRMISMSYQQGSAGLKGSQSVQGLPPQGAQGGKDPLGVYNAVDTDASGSISESEYDLLSQGILAVTGSELNSGFADFDSDGDGTLNRGELRAVLDEAGFAPPPPPPQQVIAAYTSGETTLDSTQTAGALDASQANDPLLLSLLEYLENRSASFDITA